MTTPSLNNTEILRARAQASRLNGLLKHWRAVGAVDAPLPQWDEERAHRSLQRRIRGSKLGRFKVLADFDQALPTRIDRASVEELMSLSFLGGATNVVFVGPNGVGKSTPAQSVPYQALIAGRTVLFKSASEMLGQLAALDSDSALRRRLRHYAAPDVLVIDEVGYLSQSNHHADLLFELASGRYEAESTIVTANKSFIDWSEVFPNAACVVLLMDRLVHRSEVISIEGESYRLKDARERTKARARQRKARKPAAGKGETA